MAVKRVRQENPRARKAQENRKGLEMAATDMDSFSEGRRSSGMFWFWAPVLLVLVAGAALSFAAYFSGNELTVVESIAAGFGGLVGVIVGIFGAIFGIILGLIGALIGVVAAGGAVAVTLFIVGSPIIAIILLVLLLRRPKTAECPDPGAH